MSALFSLCYILLAFLAAAYCRRVFCRDMPPDGLFHGLTLFVLFSVAFFGGFLFLGSLELLTGRPLVHPLWGCLVLAAASLLLRATSKPGSVPLFPAPNLPASLSRYREWIPGSAARWLVVATLGFFIIATFFSVMQFPIGFEARAYHLPIAVRTFQLQTLQIWDAAYMHTYPANASILFGLLLSMLPEKLVSAANLLFVIPFLAALYGLALQTGASRQAALISSLGILSIPIITFSVFQLGSDIGGITYFAIAVYFVGNTLSGGRQGLLFAGLAAGLAFGFKSLHLMGIAFLTLTLLLAEPYSRGGGSVLQSLRVRTQAASVFLCGVLAMAGFWLARNFIELANPLYPVSLPVISSLLGWAAAPDIDFANRLSTQYEWVRSSWEWPLYPWIEWHVSGQNFKHSSGFGLFFAAMVPVSFLVSLAAAIWNRRRTILVFHVLGTVFVLVIWWLMGDRQPRYLVGAFVFLMPLVSWTLTQPADSLRRVWSGLAVAFIVIMFLLIGMNLTIDFGRHIIYAKRYERFAYYVYPKVIDELPPGSRILNLAGRIWSYPLYGKSRQNEVISYIESLRQFSDMRIDSADVDLGPERWTSPVSLSADKVKALGATHVFVTGTPALVLEGAITLREVGRLDEMPVIGGKLKEPNALYEIDLHE